MKQKPGIYENVSYSEYAAWDGYNATQIKRLLIHSPKAMRHVQLHGEESTTEFEVGGATHMCVFQRDLFDASYAAYPGRRQGKIWDEFEARMKEERREILTMKEWVEVEAMAMAVREHGPAEHILEQQGRAELSIVWNDPTTGALCKGRIDWVTHILFACLKTARDIRPFAFQSQATRLMYYVQMAAYQSGLWALGQTHIEEIYFIAVGKDPWHDVAVYQLDDQALVRGLAMWEEGLGRALECERNKHWPGCCPNVETFSLPEWAQTNKASLITVGGESAFGDEE